MFSYPNNIELNARLNALRSEIEAVLISYQKQHQMTLLPLRVISNKFNGRCRKFPEPRPTVNILLRDLEDEQRLGVIMSTSGKYFVVAPIMWRNSLKCEDLGGFQWQPLIDARERWLSRDPEVPVAPSEGIPLTAEPELAPRETFDELMVRMDEIRK